MKRLTLLSGCLLTLACSDGGGGNSGQGGHGGGHAGTTGGAGHGGEGGQGAGGFTGSAGTTGIGGQTGGVSGGAGATGAGGATGGASGGAGSAGVGGQTGGTSGEAGAGGTSGGGGTSGTAGRGGTTGTAGGGGQTGGRGGSGGNGGSGKVCGGIAGLRCDVGEWCDFPGETCGAGDQQGQCQQPQGGIICAQIAVCGCDGKTYQTACSAHLNGVDTVSNLSCIPGNGGSGAPCGQDADCMSGYKCCVTAGRVGAPIACQQVASGAACPSPP